MRDLSVMWSSPINRITRIVGMIGVMSFCVAMVMLWLYASTLSVEIQQANQRADLERQCAKALEAWVHQQVAPNDDNTTAGLGKVKDKACRTHVTM